jgi:hypothetical protein
MTLATAPDGREFVVVVVKGTFRIPDREDRAVEPAEDQVPPVMCEVPTGEPGLSAPLYDIDFAPVKPRCDILLNGSAYAPGGKPAERVTVSLQVGSLVKSFDVVGHRAWRRGVLMVTPTDPEPFTVMPISYNNAYGGVDRTQEDPAKHRWYPSNHAGLGYHEDTSAQAVEGKPLPNTEEEGQPVTSPRGKYRPMAFGPLGRAWHPRVRFAGTYDAAWRDKKAPFLPDDFDDRYFQSAPEEQQIPYPRGGELVILVNLTASGRTAFRLPPLDLPVVFTKKDGQLVEVPAVVDTVILEPDQARLLLTWRARLPLRRNPFEVVQAAVGKPAEYWRRLEEREERQMGKMRFASLAALAEWNGRRGPPPPEDEE